MRMSFPDIDDILLHIRRYYEDAVFMPADVEALALSNGIELGAFVASCYLP